MTTTDGVEGPEDGCHVGCVSVGQVTSWSVFVEELYFSLHYVVNLHL